MFILFDANVWISQQGLQSRYGAAVRYFAMRQNAIIVIPEIVQLEVEERLTRQLLKLRAQIKDNYRRLLPVMGRVWSDNLPTEEDIREQVKNIIPDFDVQTRLIPFSLEAARSSLQKVLRKIPPAKTKEEFRDGVIWAHCLELLSEGDVLFVTRDTDFYEQGNIEKGLAQELVNEMRETSKAHEIKIFPDLVGLLSDIRAPFPIDKTQVIALIQTKERERISELLEAHGFELDGCLEGELNCFATEKANEVYVRFELTQTCHDATGADRHAGRLRVEGSGILDAELTAASDVFLATALLDYPDWDPDGCSRGWVSISAHFKAPNSREIQFPLD